MVFIRLEAFLSAFYELFSSYLSIKLSGFTRMDEKFFPTLSWSLLDFNLLLADRPLNLNLDTTCLIPMLRMLTVDPSHP